MPTIVAIEEPSHASERKYDPSPNLQGSFSPLPEGTSLAPLRDFPLADLSGQSGRQLAEFTSEQIQTSYQIKFVNSVEDWDLQTPIAPPLTSLEGARVISVASTSISKELVRSDVSLNLSETVAHEQSETRLSEHQLSAHTDTYTSNTDLLTQIQICSRNWHKQRLRIKSKKHKWKNGLLFPPLYRIN